MARIGGWSIELPDMRVVWSDETCLIHEVPIGTQPTLEQAIKFYAPESLSKIEVFVGKCISDGIAFDDEFKFITANGKKLWVRAIGEAVRNEAGGIIRIQGAFQDITAVKQIETERFTDKQFYRELFDNAPTGMVAVNPVTGNFVRVNKVAQELYGYSEEELLGKTVTDLTHLDDLSESKHFNGLLINGQIDRHFVEKRYLKKDGSYFWAHSIISALKDNVGNTMLFIGNFSDITERKRYDQLLQQWSDAFNHAALGIVLGNSVTQRVMAANPAFAGMLGYTVDEIIDFPILEIYSPSDRDRVKELIAIANNKGSIQYESRMVSKGRNEIPVQVNVEAIKDSNGQPLYRVATVQDISERQAATKALYEAKEFAERAAQARSSFLSNMSHEIRTPMNGIIGLSELALNQSMSEELREYLSKISASSKSLIGILNDILDFSKLEASGIIIENIPFDLDALLDTIRNLFEERALEKNIGFGIEIGEGVPRDLIGDALRIQQILSNLVSNAIKFTGQGKVNIKIAANKSEQSHCQLTFTVQDSGIGIAETDLNKLFKPFSQVDGSITRKFGGTGLGLAISRDLLKLMGGVFRINSTSGEGTTFSFDLILGLVEQVEIRELRNRTKSSAGQLTETLKKAGAGLHGARILVAEDNRVNQVIVSKFLALAGIEVVIVNNGQEVLDILNQQSFDGILMDMHMPVMGGIEATKNIRSNPAYSVLPIIALTAGVTQEEKDGCLNSGMNDFITKPIDSKILISTLNKWVQI
jgi:PAS domain S-box-containing protein